VTLYWIDFQGNCQQPYPIKTGKVLKMSTYAGHISTDRKRIFSAEKKPMIAFWGSKPRWGENKTSGKPAVEKMESPIQR